MPPRLDSPRFQLVVARAAELLEIAIDAGAPDIYLAGSVATGLDHDADGAVPASDIDFYIRNYPSESNGESTAERSLRMEAGFVAVLGGHKVEICGTPQRPVDGEYEQSMRRDAIRLVDLL
jgi:hypothetical protein